MNKHQLTAQVAAETSVTRAAADALVGAVFSAIADALARDETVAIAGFGKSPSAAAPRGPDATLRPASPSPSRRRGRRRSSRRKRFATRSTHSGVEPARCPHFVPPASPQPSDPQSLRGPRAPERLSQRGAVGFCAFVNRANTRAVAPGDGIPSRAGTLLRPDANLLLRQCYAPLRRPILQAFPPCLRPSSLTSRSTASYVQHGIPGATHRLAPRRRTAGSRYLSPS